MTGCDRIDCFLNGGCSHSVAVNSESPKVIYLQNDNHEQPIVIMPDTNTPLLYLIIVVIAVLAILFMYNRK